MPPSVTVVMPAYQAGRTVGAAISSVLWQSYPDVDVVVVDDGATDETGAIASSFGGRVHYVRQENAGVAAARNRGIAESRGELIALCDADDILFETHIEALVDAYLRHGDLVTANAFWLYPEGIQPDRTVLRDGIPAPELQREAILQRNFVSTMSIFPRSMVEEIGPFDTGTQPADDWDFWLRAVLAGHPVGLQARPLALYRWAGGGLSWKHNAMDAGMVAVLRKVAARDDLSPDQRAYVERRLSQPQPSELVRQGDAALRGGDYADAARLLRAAAGLATLDRRLMRKARLLGLAPWLIGPLLRGRQQKVERDLGIEGRYVR